MAIRPGRASQAGDSLTALTGVPRVFFGVTTITITHPWRLQRGTTLWHLSPSPPTALIMSLTP